MDLSMVVYQFSYFIEPVAYTITFLLLYRDNIFIETTSWRKSSIIAFVEGWTFLIFNLMMISPNQSFT